MSPCRRRGACERARSIAHYEHLVGERDRRGSRGPPSTLCRRRHPPVRPPGLVGDPESVRSGKPASARRSLWVLRALLAAMIATAALLGAAVPALAGQQLPPIQPTSSQPPSPEQPGLP